MLVIQQQIAADLQPHKKCSIIADGTYDSCKREATVFVTGTYVPSCGTWRCRKGEIECHVLWSD